MLKQGSRQPVAEPLFWMRPFISRRVNNSMPFPRILGINYVIEPTLDSRFLYSISAMGRGIHGFDNATLQNKSNGSETMPTIAIGTRFTRKSIFTINVMLK